MSRKILFLLSHQPNPRFIKQIKYLSKNNTVSVVYYFRDYLKDLSSEYNDNVVLNERLGSIYNGSYVRRMGDYFKSFAKIKIILKENIFDTLIVNNIDTLALFKLGSFFTQIEMKNIIEISDLRSHTYTHNIKSKLIKSLEKFMFKYVDKLIVTSPKFYDMYYNILFKGQYFLLENKPLSSMIPSRLSKQNNDKIIIGIVGLLLQGKPYETLFETIKYDDRFEVHVYGKGAYQILVEEYASKCNNIKYFGEYNFFQDSAKIYANLDILYMPYNTTNGSLNNKIALPNKLYEAMYFHVPIITSNETYLGELVEEYKIGMAIKCCNKEELLNSLECLDRKKIEKNFVKLDKEKYIADNDYVRLEKYIKL
jgi:succinoglycan biosynthesis protein ExoL